MGEWTTDEEAARPTIYSGFCIHFLY